MEYDVGLVESRLSELDWELLMQTAALLHVVRIDYMKQGQTAGA